MIEGVTKPFEPGQPPLSQTELQAATAAYKDGLTDFIERFGQGLLSLTAIQESTGDEVGFTVETHAGLVTAHAPNVQIHAYGADKDGVVRRADSQEMGSVVRQPEEERFTGSPLERLHQAMAQVDREQEMGIDNQLVDAEEVRALFTLIGSASLDVIDPEAFDSDGQGL